jgi:hypothetical protein
MAAFNKFNQFTKDLVDGIHDFDNHVFKVMLTNTSPVATNTVRANLTEVAAGNGYVAGGATTTVTTSTSAGTARVTCSDVVFTATGGAIGPIRFAVLYNDSPSSPADPLIGWFDYGSSITLADGETLTVDFDASTGVITIA